jgi:hypothetical protein
MEAALLPAMAIQVLAVFCCKHKRGRSAVGGVGMQQ